MQMPTSTLAVAIRVQGFSDISGHPSYEVLDPPAYERHIFIVEEAGVRHYFYHGAPKPGRLRQETVIPVEGVVAVAAECEWSGILRCYCLTRDGVLMVAVRDTSDDSGGMLWDVVPLLTLESESDTDASL